MYVVSVMLPIVYAVGLFFSLRTHKFIYEQFEKDQEESEASISMPTWVCVIVLVVATILYSVISEVLSEKMPEAIDQLHLTERFVGLFFYTLIPAVGEFINACRFALQNKLGLSLEIGNQGAMVVSLIQMPALVLLSVILGYHDSQHQFTLMFEMIDIFAVIISVLLRNSMLQEHSINYFTGFSFLVLFVLISIVYFFDPW
jgi:Ca2+:H+ antiporter